MGQSVSRITAQTEREIRADPANYRRRWSLLDREGVRHLPLCENDDDASWTPVACGEGIVLPGPQSRNPVTCHACIKARRAARKSGVGLYETSRPPSNVSQGDRAVELRELAKRRPIGLAVRIVDIELQTTVKRGSGRSVVAWMKAVEVCSSWQ